ncbi:MAG: O-antigen ligase family protein [Proteobacteria bacterium]|nr:O-antigen ligase family protein [Pseudomonadota bacterium]
MAPSVFMLAVLILYVPNQGHLPSSLGIMGLNVFNILFALAVIVTILQPAARHAAVGQRPPFTGTLLFYYGILALALVIAFLRGTPHLLEDIVAYKNLVTYSLLYFLAYYGVRNSGQIRFLLFVVLAVFVLAAIEAIVQGVGYGLHDYTHEKRASGPFGEDAGNSNFAGVFYAVFASFALGIVLLGRQVLFRYRMLAAVAYGIGCLAILATFSRQAFLVIGVTTLLLALRRNPLIAVGVVGFMLAYPLWAPQGVVERISMTQQTTVSGQEVLESSAASRYDLWNGAIEIIKRNPAGIGLNQFQREIEPYLPEWIEARDAQNMYLRFAAEAGLQGLLAFMLVLAAFFRIGLWTRRLDHPADAKVLGTAFLVSTIAVCMGNIFSSTFAFGEIMANYWVLAGLLSKYYMLAANEVVPRYAGTAASVPPLERFRNVYARWQDGRGESETGR